ncbi:MAG: exo-alpha-sialidase [Clostridia bacterium]|nr:exo-alpha-sialidase [Clostridia bacterium]
MKHKNALQRVLVFAISLIFVLNLFSLPMFAEALSVQKTWSPADGYVQNRIPGIIAAADGSLLVYWEARRSDESDTEHTAIEIWRSTDNGQNFTKVQTLGDGQNTRYTNPVMVVDQEDTVHLLYVSATGSDGVYHMTSTDHGLTWSAPVNIIDAFEKETIGWDMVNLGPGHGICLQNGEHAGRLIFSAWCHTGTFDVYTLYSDDNGKTWQLGECADGNYDETAIAELSDGSVMLNSRQYTVSYDTDTSVPGTNTYNLGKPDSADEAYRYITVSDTGIGGWSDTRMDTALQNPSVQGSMVSATVNGQHVLIYIGCDSKTARENLSVRCSYDDGKSWSSPIRVKSSSASYSDLVIVDQTVYVIYESHPNEKLFLTSFSLSNFEDPSTVFWVGKGTASEPYLLERMQDMEKLCNSEQAYANTYFKLCFDPDFSTVVNFKGIGNQTVFAGCFDGNGHTVINDLNNSMFAKLTNEQNVTNLNHKINVFSDKNYAQIGTTEDFRIRFVSELNCAPELLSEAGFEVTIVYRGKTANETLKSSVVYTSLSGDGETYTPEIGLYFLACGIKEIPTDDVVSVSFRPFVTTQKGMKLFGNTSDFNAVDFDLIYSLAVSNYECNYVSWDRIVVGAH